MMPINFTRQTHAQNAAADLAPLEGESITSSLWRFAWRNGLRAKELIRFCSRGASYEKDHAKFTLAAGFDAKVFAESSLWVQKSDEPKWRVSRHRHHVDMWWAADFRYCPICLEHVYHSFWHQNLFITHCPIDGAALKTRCYCCGSVLPAYGFHYKILDSPYICSTCGGPIAGVEPTVSARLEMQEQAKLVRSVFLALALWWELGSAARSEFEFLVGERNVHRYAPWLESDTSIRQWVIDRAPPCSNFALSSRTIPKLVIFKWRIRLSPPDLLERLTRRRIPAEVQLDLARQVYKATLRVLVCAVQKIRPFNGSEHRRYLVTAPSDIIRHSSDCNMLLLALTTLRRQYETYFSLWDDDISEAVFQIDLAKFGGELEFGRRVRIYWRLRFLAEFGAIFWCVTALRNGNPEAQNGNLRMASLEAAKIDLHDEDHEVAEGSIAFPAVDGFDLCKLARRSSANHASQFLQR
jgi:hypothetical protein